VTSLDRSATVKLFHATGPVTAKLLSRRLSVCAGSTSETTEMRELQRYRVMESLSDRTVSMISLHFVLGHVNVSTDATSVLKQKAIHSV